MRGSTTSNRLRAREATALYVDMRGRAQGMSTVRLRWELRWLRRQAQHSPERMIRRRAAQAELADRGQLERS